MFGAGLAVAARTVVNDVSRNDCSLSENTTNAEPTDGAPASSRVCTNHTEALTFSSRPLSVSPLAANLCRSSSWSCTWPMASSRSSSILSRASSTAAPKPTSNASTRSSVLPSRYS